ncbi:TAXI family TRAP transporter solute-binding subunit [Lysinibacillus capsici]|uniref:TAXI family TRAP transporter solute-binding subunit n=1 Tax=Lysinibacillus TaxID=400634 RepID=UPI00065307E4|nr:MULTISPECIES: TAXI family TRAP transporter solute-binding subunit [Lysinibacillus]KMN39312.1 immunogenic protein [Lysinibacillus sp. LK3]MCR6523743.1 TAXI family TRAP transporter solute-binding subunit [Lysinibacillus capsici]MCT1539549.1 TAXI family TRAP transporter solute-binding subunit [Lysinibacillus capsici]MCT1570384.1 TAXI family TRAP transporter solute-binding subunit [Lysinibacillus capsici]MCT1647708.1 TAXI family TRAP transporter solute-binding subunit [Lysinibacillus capsici]
MRKKQFNLLMLLSILALMILAACGSDSGSGSKDTGDDSESTEKPKFLSLLTGGTQGTYYALGGTFADLITTDTGIKTTAEVSQASAANMTALQEGKGEIAFVQTDIAYYATEGKLMFDGNKIDTISALGALYPETVQLVTTEASGIKTYADLKGKKVSVGAPGSGTYANAEQLLEINGLTMDDIKAQNLDFGESTDGLQSGQIDAAFITAGTPTGAVEALNATTKVNIIGLDAGKADEIIAKYPYYAKDTVKAGTYGIANDVETVSVLAMLAVKKDLPEDVVYSMTKAIYDNTGKISHAKGEFIKAETGLDGISIDIHPGAQKYFNEKK